LLAAGNTGEQKPIEAAYDNYTDPKLKLNTFKIISSRMSV